MTTFTGELMNFSAMDFVAIVSYYKGGTVGEQAKSILVDGESYEDQNDNALKYIADYARERDQHNLSESIEDYLNR